MLAAKLARWLHCRSVFYISSLVCILPRFISNLGGTLQVYQSRKICHRKDITGTVIGCSTVCVCWQSRSSQSRVQEELNVVDICTAFGLYIRFIVSLNESETSAEDIIIKKCICDHDVKSAPYLHTSSVSPRCSCI